MREYDTVRVDTKTRIINAFWELYKTTRIEKITVKRVTDACGIYRTTFYLHFADVYAVLEHIEGMLLREIRGINVVGENPTKEERERFTNELTGCFSKNFDYLRVLLDEKHDPEFAKIYKEELICRMWTLHQVDINMLNEESKEIASKSLGAMVDLFLALGDSPKITMETLRYVIDGYMKKGVINTITSL